MKKKEKIVLSLFSGIGLWDLAFEHAGFTIVRGPDLLWGSNIKNFDASSLHGIIGGIIGGVPCQYAADTVFKEYRHLYENLWPEFWEVVARVSPIWVLAECVPGARKTCTSFFFEASMGASWRIINFANLGSAQKRSRLIVYKGPNQEKFWEILNSMGMEYGCEWRKKIGREIIPYEDKWLCITGSGIQHGSPSSINPRKLIRLCKDDLLNAFDLPSDWDKNIPVLPLWVKSVLLCQGVPLAAGYALARTVKKLLEAAVE